MVSKFFDRPFDRTFDFLWPPGHAKKKDDGPIHILCRLLSAFFEDRIRNGAEPSGSFRALDFVQDTGSFRLFPARMLDFLQRKGPRAVQIRLLRAKTLDISNIDRLPAPERCIRLDLFQFSRAPLDA